MAVVLGIDTSCYTTSLAAVSVGESEKEHVLISEIHKLLPVEYGKCGLRQSDAVFLHTKNFELILKEFFSVVNGKDISAVCVSAKPRSDENSYMPVFLSGKAIAVSLSSAMRVPLFETTHQSGHIRASLYDNRDLIGKEFLSVHISGGTTDILRVKPDGLIELLGYSTDLHAGQLFDRIGTALNLPFPCGKHMEAIASRYTKNSDYKPIPTSVKGICCSVSGAESYAKKMLIDNTPTEQIAYSLYDFFARTLCKMLVAANQKTGLSNCIIAGGVASSNLLKGLILNRLKKTGCGMSVSFCMPERSTDNAVGVALLGADKLLCLRNSKNALTDTL